MAKKLKKFLKKAGKAAAVAAALYGASKLGRKGNVAKTAASEDANIGYSPLRIYDDYNYKPKIDLGGNDPGPTLAAEGGRIGKKHGGKVTGIAKRGFGRALMKGKK